MASISFAHEKVYADHLWFSLVIGGLTSRNHWPPSIAPEWRLGPMVGSPSEAISEPTRPTLRPRPNGHLKTTVPFAPAHHTGSTNFDWQRTRLTKPVALRSELRDFRRVVCLSGHSCQRDAIVLHNLVRIRNVQPIYQPQRRCIIHCSKGVKSRLYCSDVPFILPGNEPGSSVRSHPGENHRRANAQQIVRRQSRLLGLQ